HQPRQHPRRHAPAADPAEPTNAKRALSAGPPRPPDDGAATAAHPGDPEYLDPTAADDTAPLPVAAGGSPPRPTPDAHPNADTGAAPPAEVPADTGGSRPGDRS